MVPDPPALTGPLRVRIPGLRLVRELGRGGGSVLLLALHQEGEDQREVVVKLPLRADDLGDDPVLHYRREAARLGCLAHPAFPEALEVGDVEGFPYLVRSYQPGATLGERVFASTLPPVDAARMGRRLAGALRCAHRRGHVHGALRPDSVLVDTFGLPGLLDLGFLGDAHAQRQNPDLAYAAPEQTGLLHRPVDPRTDLYALGALLYFCVTGRPPFVADDAELVRLHMAAPPPRLDEVAEGVPEELAELVGRLLAKDPDDRPGSAGLVAEALHRLAEGSALPARAPRRFDPPPLVERGEPLGLLNAAWNEVVRGRGGVALIEGCPGHGATRLARELSSWVLGTGGIALWCAGARTGGQPLDAIRQLLDDLAARLREPGSAEHPLGEAVTSAAGAGLGTLSALSPALSRALRAPPAGSEPEAAETLYGAVVDFFCELAAVQLGVLLVVDDAHWLDSASRQVFRRLARRLGGTPVMVLATAPSEEEDPEAAERLVEALGGGVPLRVRLEPLSAAGTSELTTGLLGGRVPPQSVLRLLHTRGAGSPFAIEHYVESMVDAGLVRPHWGRWVVDDGVFDAVGLPANTVELVLRRFSALSAETQRVLRVAALLGPSFTLTQLREVVGFSQVVSNALAQAVAAQVLERRDAERVAFCHDQVVDVLLREMSYPARRALHQRIATALDEAGDPDLFAIARHYAEGEQEATPGRARAANLAAGREAMRRFADEDAYAFLLAAARVGDYAGLDPDPAIDEVLGQVCDRLGRVTEAVDAFQRALDRVEEPRRRAEIRTQLTWVHTSRYDAAAARRELSQGFAELGLPLPHGGTAQSLRSAAMTTLSRWARRVGTSLEVEGAEAQEGVRTLMRLLDVGAWVGYVCMDPRLMVGAIREGTVLAERLGPSPERALSMAMQSILHAGSGHRRDARRAAEDAVAEAERLEDPVLLARVQAHRTWCLHMAGYRWEAETVGRRCLEAHGNWLDPVSYVAVCYDLSWNSAIRGYALAAVNWAETARERLSGLPREPLRGHPFANPSAPALAALGRTEEAREVLTAYRAIAQETPDSVLRWTDLLANEVGFRYEAAELGLPFDDAVIAFGAHGLPPETVQLQLRSFYLYVAYARARQGRLDALVTANEGLERAAVTPVLQGHLKVCQASAARMRDDADGALALLLEAEALAEAHDAPWVLFEALTERAHVRLSRDDVPAATRAARLALALASEHGWAAREERLREAFPDLAIGRSPIRGAPADPFALRARRHLDALLNVSLALTSTLDARTQIRQTLDQLVRLFGAERAFLFLEEPEGGGARLAGARSAVGEDLGPEDLDELNVVHDVRHQRRPVIHRATAGAGPRSVIAAPLTVADRLAGVVYLDSQAAAGIFDEGDVDILVAVASHIPAALETARAAQLDVYGRIAANVPGMIFQLARSPRGALRFAFASEGVWDLLGVQPAAVEQDAERFLRGLRREDRDGFVISVARAAERGARWSWTGRSGHRHGPRWLEGAARVESRPDGAALFEGIILDVTNLKEAEDALRKLNAELEARVEARTRELEAANRELEAFTYSASHDLRGVLRTVMMFSQGLVDDYGDKLDDEGKYMLRRIASAGGRMTEMLDSMLQLSRLGRAALDRAEIDLGDVVRAVESDLRTSDPERSVELVVGEDLGLYADAHLMLAVVQNLVGNAWKFTRDEERARIEVGVTEADGQRVFYVKDNGAGFDMQYAGKLWQAFHRLHDARDFEGTGIGLSSVKRVIERHGGRVWAEAEEGKGATFFFTVPREGGTRVPRSLPPPPVDA